MDVALLITEFRIHSIINAFLRVQTNIAVHMASIIAASRNLTYIDRREACFRTFIRAGSTATGDKHIIADACNINFPGCIYTQRAQIADDKFFNYLAVCFHLCSRVISIIGLNHLVSVFIEGVPKNIAVGISDIHFLRRIIGIISFPSVDGLVSLVNRNSFCHITQNISFGAIRSFLCFVTHYGHVCRIRVSQLFHFFNRCFGTADKFADLNLSSLIGIQTDALGYQRHIPALYVGNLILSFRTHTAFLVHNSIPDGIKQLILRPGKLRLLIFFHHCLISRVIPQVCSCAVIGLTAGHREHIRQMTFALIVCKMGKLIIDADFVIILRLYHSKIAVF